MKNGNCVVVAEIHFFFSIVKDMVIRVKDYKKKKN